MPCTVIQGKTTDELSVGRCAVLHGHDFNHVQIWLLGSSVDSENGIDNVGGKLLGKCTVQFRTERSPSDRQQQLTVDCTLDLELIEELYTNPYEYRRSYGPQYLSTDLKSLVLRDLISICDYSRVQSFGNITVCLLQKFSHQQHHRSCSITSDIILCCRSPGNHDLRQISIRRSLWEREEGILRRWDFGFAV